MRKLIILAIIVAAAGLARAATYYVDSDDGRNDPSQSGGPLDPWRTITYALSCVSGENTFMCRGTFEEEVTVGEDDAGSEFFGNPEATLVGGGLLRKLLRRRRRGIPRIRFCARRRASGADR